MRDSLEDLELSGGRFSDPKGETPVAAAASSLPPQQLRRAMGGKHVCPFCGTQRESDIGSCPNCSLEDSPTTRSATRSKLGPWYVLQSRNPSAPGMNFATLMVLVQKGRVTARSVVRGPTTGQFWRHAARVKGVSREFGLCWSCGGDVARNARACPACKRNQEPPTDPDILLESGVEVNDDELTEAIWADHGPEPVRPVSRPAPVAETPAAAEQRQQPSGPQSPVERLVARGGVRREVASVNRNGNGAATATREVPRTAATTASPRASLSRAATEELAANNLDMAVFNRSRQRGAGGVAGKVFKSLFVAILILCSGVVAMASFDAGMREKLIHWGGAGKTWVTSTIHTLRFGKPAQPSDPAGAELARAGDGTAAAQAVGENGEKLSPEQAKLRMWELWRAGSDAERKGDFAGAVRAWEQIRGLKMPAEELPLGFDARLATAKKRVK